MQWLFVVIPARPDMLQSGPTTEEMAAVNQHFAYWKRLTEEGVALVVGRTQTTDEGTMGVAIFRAEGEDRASAIAERDPAVEAGVFKMRLYPYAVALLGEPGPFRP